MGWLLPLFIGAALAAQPPTDIDQNTKIQGGADVRDSDASAGGRSGPGPETERPRVDERGEGADRESREKEKPTSARKPRDEREPGAAKAQPPSQ